jgi:3-oxoacyl-[acyl-carrier protein] reductase
MIRGPARPIKGDPERRSISLPLARCARIVRAAARREPGPADGRVFAALPTSSWRGTPMGKLDGKVALVTGSGRNIGRATVLKLAAEGAHVVVNARTNREEAEAVAREARERGVKALAVLADVARKDQVDAMVAKALSEFGRIDILINNAAIRPHKPFTELTMEDWEAVRGVVLDGALYCTRATIPAMVENRYGRILFFTGDGAFTGGSGRAHVSAAKMGLVGMARALASEFATHNIRVNVVSPGSIDTRRDNPEWYRGHVPSAAGIPLGRQGMVDEIAATCLFLVSDDGGFITGQTIHVNGGTTYY